MKFNANRYQMFVSDKINIFILYFKCFFYFVLNHLFSQSEMFTSIQLVLGIHKDIVCNALIALAMCCPFLRVQTVFSHFQ